MFTPDKTQDHIKSHSRLERPGGLFLLLYLYTCMYTASGLLVIYVTFPIKFPSNDDFQWTDDGEFLLKTKSAVSYVLSDILIMYEV